MPRIRFCGRDSNPVLLRRTQYISSFQTGVYTYSSLRRSSMRIFLMLGFILVFNKSHPDEALTDRTFCIFLLSAKVEYEIQQYYLIFIGPSKLEQVLLLLTKTSGFGRIAIIWSTRHDAWIGRAAADIGQISRRCRTLETNRNVIRELEGKLKSNSSDSQGIIPIRLNWYIKHGQHVIRSYEAQRILQD